jgi:hypothetical protein
MDNSVAVVSAVNNDALGYSYYADLLLPYEYQPYFTMST